MISLRFLPGIVFRQLLPPPARRQWLISMGCAVLAASAATRGVSVGWGADPLEAGVGVRDITPDPNLLPVPLGGYGEP